MNNSKEMCHPLFLPFECHKFDPFPQVEPSVHYFAEVVLVRKGALRVVLDREEFSVSAGEAAVICPGARHRIVPAEGEPAAADLLRFDPDRIIVQPFYCAGLKTVLNEARRTRMLMHLSAAEAESMLLPKFSAFCMKESEEQAFGYDINIQAWLCRICVSLVRFWMERGLSLPDADREERIYSLTGYIQNHLQDSLRVEDLAEYCGLSYPWFAKKFREIYGVSCKDFIEQIRVNRVEQYLRFTDLDLAAVSEATGYADCSHMIKNFKRVKGITPGQFRLRECRQQ